MINKTLPVLLSFLFLTLTASADWYQQEVTNVVSLNFPAQPNISRDADHTGFIHQTDSCSFQAQTKAYIDEGKVHDSLTLAAFYDGTTKGIIRATKGTLISKTYIRIGKLKGIEIEFSRTIPNSITITICSRVLLVNGQLLIYTFTAPSPRYAGLKGLRDRYMSSVSFHKDIALTQYRSEVIAPDRDTMPTVPLSPTASMLDTTKAAPVPVTFIHSHAGFVVKLFGILILFSALIYFFATLSRRKG